MDECIPQDVLRLGYCRRRPKAESYKTAYKRWSRLLYNRMRVQKADPLPWITYEAIIYMLTHLEPGDTMFEWGGGASTLFWRSFGLNVMTVESSAGWAETIGCKAVGYRTDEYIDALDRPYDVVVIDGMRRVECFMRAIQYARRMIVLDNSNWPEHRVVHDKLSDGWEQVICGMLARRSPFGNGSRTGKWITTVFVRKE